MKPCATATGQMSVAKGCSSETNDSVCEYQSMQVIHVCNAVIILGNEGTVLFRSTTTSSHTLSMVSGHYHVVCNTSHVYVTKQSTR